MKTKSFFLLVFIIISKVYSQYPPCAPYDPAYYYTVPKLTNFPDYSLNMPYDVLIGYVAVDSVSYYANPMEAHDFIMRQTYNDTLRTMMKHYYAMVDYDPLLFLATESFRDENISCYLSHSSFDLDKKIRLASPNSFYDYALCRADIIVHVRITDTVSAYDSSLIGETLRAEIVNVTCEILDTIKGKVLPACDPELLSIANSDQPDFIPPWPDNCLKFSYCKYWTRSLDDYNKAHLFDDDGLPWIKTGKEYVVFLKLLTTCVSGDDIVYCVRPVWPESKVFLMYPVDENGNVYNPGNEFGIENNSSVQVFKDELRQQISNITEFTIE